MTKFMQHQITNRKNWLQVETNQGTTFIDADGIGLHVRDSDPKTHPLTEDQKEEYQKEIGQYCEGLPQSWENISGYGARLSAPGYLDCTDWSVFETLSEAEQYLNETYPEDEDETDAAS